MAGLYNTPPRDMIFEELKNEAIRAWYRMSERKTLAKWKISVIEDIENIDDGFMYIFDQCCDGFVQHMVLDYSSEDTRQAVYVRKNPLHDGSSLK